MLSVLVVSQDSRFLDCVGNAIQGEGMSAVCIEKIGAVEVVQRGYRPGAIVVDPTTVLEPGGDELVRYLSDLPGLADVPVFSISSAATRVELADLLGALRRLEEGDERAVE